MVEILEVIANQAEYTPEARLKASIAETEFYSVFSLLISHYEPIYIASIIDSLSKVNAADPFWRLIEQLLARKDFFEKIEELGLIALILSKFA